MRLLSVRLIVSLILGITLVSLGFSYYQVIGEKRGLSDELKRRADVLGESLAGNVEKLWDVASGRELQRLVQRFGHREHLVGVAVYDRQEKLVAITPELGKALGSSPDALNQALAEDHNENSFVRLGGDRVHILALPLHYKEAVVGGLVVVHDASYIHAQVLRVWRETFVRVLVQVFLIVLITLLIVRWSIAGPIAHAAQWMRALRTGRISSRQQMPDLEMFRPLAREVATMAAEPEPGAKRRRKRGSSSGSGRVALDCRPVVSASSDATGRKPALCGVKSRALHPSAERKIAGGCRPAERSRNGA